MTVARLATGDFYLGDCLDVMARLPDASVDMVLCDLPYGTTQNKWDTVIPLAPLWAQYWRVAKPGAAIVLTAAQPFTTKLIASQIAAFRYDWVYGKPPANPLNAKKRPMPAHESVIVFYQSSGVYNPQGLLSVERKRGPGSISYSPNYGKIGQKQSYVQTNTNYPTSRLPTFPPLPNAKKAHPTQKPVALFDYLMRTYTNPGDTVLDNCAGSGTTAVAAIGAGRRWICVEREEDYWTNAVARVVEAEGTKA